MTESKKNDERKAEAEEYVEVPYDNVGDQSILLLAAAEEQGLPAHVVRTQSDRYLVPKSVADAALKGDSEKRAEDLRAQRDEEGAEVRTIGAGPTGAVDTNAGEDAEQGSVQEKPAKKAAAKKSANEEGK